MGLRAWARGHRRVAPRPRRAARRGRGRGRGGEPERGGGRLVTPAHCAFIVLAIAQCPGAPRAALADAVETGALLSSVWCCHCASGRGHRAPSCTARAASRMLCRGIARYGAICEPGSTSYTHLHTQHTHIVGPDSCAGSLRVLLWNCAARVAIVDTDATEQGCACKSDYGVKGDAGRLRKQTVFGMHEDALRRR